MRTEQGMANGRVMWQWLRLIFTVFAIGYIAWYLAAHSDELAGLRVFTATELALLLMLFLGDWAIRTVEFRYVIGRLGAAIGSIEALTIMSATSLLNYLPLNAGMFVRARILKRHKDIPYALYIALMSLILFAALSASGLVGLIALFAHGGAGVWLIGDYHAGAVLVVLLACGIVAPIVVLRLPTGLVAERNLWLFDRVHALLQGWRRIEFRAYLNLCALAGAKVIFLGFRLWICLRVLQVHDSFLLGITFAAVSTIILIVNVTPSGIGIRELLIGVLAELLGVGFTDGMLAAGLDRVVAIVFAVSSGAPGLLYLRTRKMV